MNSIRCQLLKQYPEAIETFGYVTKANRLILGIEKDHHLDSCVIASQGLPITVKTSLLYLKKSVSKGDYRQTKGIRSEQPITTGKICGFRKYDKVKYFGKEYFIKGRKSTGYAVLMNINGEKADFSYLPRGRKTPKLSNCKRVAARTSQMVQAVAI